MTKTVAFHSFRRGTGRTGLMASIAVLLAQQGKCVGIIDTNIQSPSAHIFFKMRDEDIKCTLDNFLWGECTLEQTIYDVSKTIGLDAGCLYLIPSSDNMVRIMRFLEDEVDVSVLTKAFSQFSKMHNLDYLLLDSSSGITQDILLSLSVADVLAIVMRLDEQDYQGVSITLELAKRLELEKTLVLINQVPLSFNLDSVETQIRESFKCRVGAALPFSDEYINLASEEIFALKYPDHPLTLKLKELVAKF